MKKNEPVSKKKTLVSNKHQEKKIMYQGFYRKKSDEKYKEKETQQNKEQEK